MKIYVIYENNEYEPSHEYKDLICICLTKEIANIQLNKVCQEEYDNFCKTWVDFENRIERARKWAFEEKFYIEEVEVITNG